MTILKLRAVLHGHHRPLERLKMFHPPAFDLLGKLRADEVPDAYTLFAPSSRAADPSKSGRFNLGEKLVLALCRKARIVSTTGGLVFDGDNRRRTTETRVDGTLFSGEIRMTRDELAETIDALTRLIPRVPTFVNRENVPKPTLLKSFRVKLPTEIADADGNLRRTVRECEVEVYEPDALTGKGDLNELGCPVVETEWPWRVNVLQKVPLNTDRDNVPPSFLKAVQVAVLNQMHEAISPEQASATWAREATGDSRATKDAVSSVLKARHGERAAVATPDAPMSNAAAAAAGFSILHGGSLTGDEWANVRKFGLLPSTTQICPPPSAEQAANREALTGRCPTCGQTV